MTLYIKSLSEIEQLAYGGRDPRVAHSVRFDDAWGQISRGEKVAGYCALASNSYTFAGSLLALPEVPWKERLYNSMIAFIHRKLAYRYVQKMAAFAGGFRSLTAEQLEVYAAVLRLSGCYDDAFEAGELGVGIARDVNTKMLLQMGIAATVSREGEEEAAVATFAFLVPKVGEMKLQDRPRFYRAFAEALIAGGMYGQAWKMLDHGDDIAFPNHLFDQHNKIERVRDRLFKIDKGRNNTL